MAEPEVATKAPESDAMEQGESKQSNEASHGGSSMMGVCLAESQTVYNLILIGYCVGTLRYRPAYSYVDLSTIMRTICSLLLCSASGAGPTGVGPQRSSMFSTVAESLCKGNIENRRH